MEPRPAARDVAELFEHRWADGDVEGAMTLIGESCVYRLHVSNEALPHGGETTGRVAIREALLKFRDILEPVIYRPTVLGADGSQVRIRVEFMYRHRQSGQMLSGYLRHVFDVENGAIVEANCYTDAALLETFIRLFGCKDDEV